METRPSGEASPLAAHEELAPDVMLERGAAPSKHDASLAGLAIHRTQGAFVPKLYTMVQSPDLPLITWTDDGERFKVSNPVEFSKALSIYFKHNNFASFVRQLNIYNFHKVHQHSVSSNPSLGSSANPAAEELWIFQHKHFRRDRPELLSLVKRKAKTSQTSSTKRPAAEANDDTLRRKRSKSALSGCSSDSANEGERSSNTPSYGRQDDLPPTTRRWNSDDGAASEHPTRPSQNLSLPHPQNSRSAPSQHAPGSPPSRPGHEASFSGRSSASFESPSWERQLAGLDAQVSYLTEALYHSRQETLAERAATSTVMRLLLRVVADLDANGARRGEISEAASVLDQLAEVGGPGSMPNGLTTPSPLFVVNKNPWEAQPYQPSAAYSSYMTQEAASNRHARPREDESTGNPRPTSRDYEPRYAAQFDGGADKARWPESDTRRGQISLPSLASLLQHGDEPAHFKRPRREV